jgi:hypothetical protein
MHRARITALALLTAFCVGGTGCMSIFFHNDGTESKDTQVDRFHHIVAFNLIELSDPVDLGDRCPNGWKTLKTERGPLAILISFFTQPFYGPMTTGVACK